MNFMKIAMIAGAALAFSQAASADDADIEKGAKVFKKCQACHTLEEGAADKIGPNLYGIFSRGVAAKEGFRYSDAMMEKAGEIGSWDEENLATYLEKPRDYVPGTNMAFIGLRKESDRTNLIAYLKKETGAAE